MSDEDGPQLVQAFFARGDVRWKEYGEYPNAKVAETAVNVLRTDEECYLIEVWSKPKCFHAVG